MKMSVWLFGLHERTRTGGNLFRRLIETFSIQTCTQPGELFYTQTCVAGRYLFNFMPIWFMHTAWTCWLLGVVWRQLSWPVDHLASVRLGVLLLMIVPVSLIGLLILCFNQSMNMEKLTDRCAQMGGMIALVCLTQPLLWVANSIDKIVRSLVNRWWSKHHPYQVAYGRTLQAIALLKAYRRVDRKQRASLLRRANDQLDVLDRRWLAETLGVDLLNPTAGTPAADGEATGRPTLSEVFRQSPAGQASERTTTEMLRLATSLLDLTDRDLNPN